MLQLKPAAYELDAPLTQVDPVQLRAGSSEPDVVGPHPHADLQHGSIATHFELRKLADERLEFVTSCLDLVVIHASPFRSGRIPGPARRATPETPNLLFCLSSRRHVQTL